MKKQAINFSWPADLSDFSTDTTQENFSRGKLKVFYKGETEDHRFFSNDFSETLVSSLPYTPVVSYYDEEKDDFVGHATEQQILGIVDPKVEPSFEKDENGIEWCVCDVVLYTERPDQVGAIAKKIVGHKQSLELDPNSVKYVVNYDDKKHFKNIEFTAGRFVGVSVLGTDQKPAFTGSEFFAYDEEFEKKMQILREYCEGKNDQETDGGKEMDFNEFMKLSWGDVSAKVDEAICNEYGNDAFTSIVDMFEDSAIVRFFYYIEGSCKLMRVKYSCNENGDVVLGDVNEVHITYEDVVAPVVETTQAQETDIEQSVVPTDDAGSNDYAENEKPEEDKPEGEPQPCPEEEGKKPEEEECSCGDPDKKDEESKCEVVENAELSSEDFTSESADPAQVENVQDTPVDEKVSVDNEQTSIEQETSSSTSFTESERAEFEALKRAEKITLVDSYKDDLSNEQYEDFISKIDSFDKKDLELELLKAYKAHSKENKPMRAFAFAPINNANTQDSLDNFVKKYQR